MVTQAVVDYLSLVFLIAAPYALASLGMVIGGRSGMFNVAGEGIMFTCGSVGFFGTYLFGNITIGLLLAILVGGMFGLVLAYLTVTRLMDQFVVGLGFFFMGMGTATLIWKLTIGVTLRPPLIEPLAKAPIPLISQIPILGEVLTQNVMVYLFIVVAVAMYLLLYKTTLGLKILAAGENPGAADTLGVNVFAVRYACTTIGGMLLGLAGAYLPLVLTGTFSDGMVGGRGWLAIALAFLGGWSPHFAVLGSMLFAGIDVLAFKANVLHIGVPYQFLRSLPYIVPILIMIVLYRRASVPVALGTNYDRERRG